MACENTYNNAEHAAAEICNLRLQRIHHASIRRDGAYAPLAVIHDSGLHLTQPIDDFIETLFEERVVFKTSQGPLHTDWQHVPHLVEPLDRFCWRFGQSIALQSGLLPWISRRERYRLLAWPDFGVIGPNPEGSRFCQLLAREQLSPQQVSRRLTASETHTSALFNSASLCGVLVAEASLLGIRRASYKAGSKARPSVLGNLWRRLKN